MKKFALSIATAAVIVSGCGDGNEETGGNNQNDQNNQNQEVNEEPEVDLADNEDNENDELNTDLDTNDENDGLDTNDNNAADGLDTESDEEAEAVLDQDVENFSLNVTLVDDTQWDFNYTPAQEEGEEPEANITGSDIELEGEQAAEEMETYLSHFHVDAATEQEEITSQIAETFEFNEEDIQEYTLTIDFPEQENETEWSWSQDQEDNGEDNQDAEDNNDGMDIGNDDENNNG